MKIAYFDCFAGASGDMILGAVLDNGLSLTSLQNELSKLALPGLKISEKKVNKNGIGGTQAIIEIEEPDQGHHHRELTEIKKIISESSLEKEVKRDSINIFTRIATAEAKIHQTDIEKVHFHEVGALDAITDIVGSVVGLRLLGIEKIYCSPFHLGIGTINCAHGMLPVPAPATAELIKGCPAYSIGIIGELLTPTGAAILTTLSDDYGPMPPMIVHSVGYGSGLADRAIPNLLRLTIGEADNKDY